MSRRRLLDLVSKEESEAIDKIQKKKKTENEKNESIGACCLYSFLSILSESFATILNTHILINVMNMIIYVEANDCDLFSDDMFMHTNR